MACDLQSQVESRKEHTIAGVRLAVSENFDGKLSLIRAIMSLDTKVVSCKKRF